MPIVVGVERHVDLLILLQFLNSASANDASEVQYTVVVEIMGLQRSDLLAPATEQCSQKCEGVKRLLQLADDAKAPHGEQTDSSSRLLKSGGESQVARWPSHFERADSFRNETLRPS